MPCRRTVASLLAGSIVAVGFAAIPTTAAGGPDDRTGTASGSRRDVDGRWQVMRTDGDGVVRWRSRSPLPVTDARPEFRVGSRVVGYPQLSADGRTLSLPLVTLGGVPPQQLEVWLGARRLDGPTQLRTGAPAPFTGPTVTPTRDPGAPGEHPVRSFDYRSAALPWREYEAPLEVLGHAVLPTDVDAAPLVLFLHGRHSACYGRGGGGWPCSGRSKPVPSYLGYDYLQQRLASQGYATVSISANAINAQDFRSRDGGAQARSALVRHHLELLTERSADPTNPRWSGALDTGRVVLVGHSRGGEGVDQAAIDASLAKPYRILGQVLIAPTDFSYQTAAYVPTEVLLPYCDGDVYDLQGQRFVDAARDLTADDRALRSSVLIRGANHNFFNTEWTPRLSEAPSFDDWFDQGDPVCGRRASQTRLGAGEQRATGATFVAAAVRAFAAAEEPMLRWLDSSQALELPWAGGAVAWTHALGGDRRTVVPGRGLAAGGVASLCRAVQPTRGRPADPGSLTACGTPRSVRQPHWPPEGGNFLSPPGVYGEVAAGPAIRMSWQSAGAVGSLSPDAAFDLSAPDASLDLRVIGAPQRPVRFRVRLNDRDSSWTSPVKVLQPFPGGSQLAPLWAQSIRVSPPSAYGFDLTAITSVDLIAVSDSGRLWALDASVRRPDLLPVPRRRLPRVSLGQVTVPEGDGRGRGVAGVPFRVRGEVVAPASFAVGLTRNTFGRRSGPSYARVEIAPGTRRGVVEVPYQRDDRNDRRFTPETVVAVPVRNMSMSDYLGKARIRDDDRTARAAR